ncbi:MAG: PCRF domain-containing protein [Candidatus Pacebacteria bacterium]|nr:PCRF domain-containing protein [Candidatus Paceibacterota bacterium]
MDTNEIQNQIEVLEATMQGADFWSDKAKAQEVIRKLGELKAEKEGFGKHDRGNAIVTIISGAGGDDAEDFSGMLLNMYMKYATKKGWEMVLIHEHKNDHNGYRNVSIEIVGKGAYGELKNENGVHRLVRVSPFNAAQKRHTSFSMVEVLPKFSKLEEKDFIIPENDLKIEFTRSGGPGGQNVNKRETAVRIVHIPTNISAHSSEERSQEANRERAMAMLRARIFKRAEEEKKSIEEAMKTDKGREIEWGSQIRSYVLHPYKMVKDHRTDTETAKVEDVLDGDIELFIEAEKNL